MRDPRLITGRNEVVPKVMFLLMSVILLTQWGCLPQCMLGYHPPQEQSHPLGADTPQEQTPPGGRHPPGADIPPGADTPQEQTPLWSRHPPGSRLRHTVNEWPVRILLECILVFTNISGHHLIFQDFIHVFRQTACINEMISRFVNGSQ